MLSYRGIMARLETEINQIYLTHPESKKSSLILYEEEISNSAHLFFIADLKNLQRKSESGILKKISEIILQSFRANKKLAAEALFESALAQINQNLADLAHEGHKAWVGKLSSLIVLKSGENIYVANDGQTSAWLLRKSDLIEIIKPEKLGTHPLKTFTNFTQGRIRAGDSAIITTANIFNFISFELFSKILGSKTLKEATTEISKILKDSMTLEEGFSTFFLSFGKKDEVRAAKTSAPADLTTAIYAPLPEQDEALVTPKSRWKLPAFAFSLPKMPKLKLPRVRWAFFQNLSFSGKFFFISFGLFLILFIGNLVRYGWGLHSKQTQNRIETLAATITTDITNAQSALIYKTGSDALQALSQTETDYGTLQSLDAAKAAQFADQIQSLQDQINKVSVINNPKAFVPLKHNPTYLNHSSVGFLFANTDSNSLLVYNNNNLTDYFLLNSLSSDITGVGYFTPAGVVVSAGNTIYHIDQNLKQFEPIVSINNANLLGAKTSGSNLVTLNTATGQILKVSFSKNKYTTTAINTGSMQDIRDFGADKDVYLLFPDKLIHVVGNNPQTFPYPALTDSISNATKIFVGANLYILEPNKKRVVILNKNGQLLNQIYFPSLSNMLDLSVDEGNRSLYILADNQLYKITY